MLFVPGGLGLSALKASAKTQISSRSDQSKLITEWPLWPLYLYGSWSGHKHSSAVCKHIIPSAPQGVRILPAWSRGHRSALASSLAELYLCLGERSLLWPYWDQAKRICIWPTEIYFKSFIQRSSAQNAKTAMSHPGSNCCDFSNFFYSGVAEFERPNSSVIFLMPLLNC